MEETHRWVPHRHHGFTAWDRLCGVRERGREREPKSPKEWRPPCPEQAPEAPFYLKRPWYPQATRFRL